MPEEFILQCQLDQPAIQAGQSADLYSLITIRPNISKIGALIESTGDVVLPAHLIVVVDVSGSMQILIEDDPKAKVVGKTRSEAGDVTLVQSAVPSRRAVAQQVVQRLVERMSPDDRLTLVAFDHEAYPLANALPPGPAEYGRFAAGRGRGRRHVHGTGSRNRQKFVAPAQRHQFDAAHRGPNGW